MADITLISGSTLGGAEYVANTWLKSWKRRVLPPKRCTVRVGRFICLGDLAGYQLNPRCRDIPDNLSPFYEALQEQKPDFLRSALAQSVLVVVNMTPFVGYR